MKRITRFYQAVLIIAFLSFCLNANATQQTVTDTLFTTTTWNTDTVFVSGNVVVLADLTINPGTEVLFQDFYYIKVNGWIIANGSVADSIIFKPSDGNAMAKWAGIRFMEGAYGSPSSFTFCEFSQAHSEEGDPDGGALTVNNHSMLTITNCKFKNNWANSVGGAIFFNSCTANITNCMFTQNEALGSGSAIEFSNTDLDLVQNVFVNNGGQSAISGTGTSNNLNCYFNTFANNNGHPISISNNNATIKGNIFSGNTNNFYFNNNITGIFENNCVPDGFWEVQNHEFSAFTFKNNITKNPEFVNPTAAAGNGEDGSFANWSLQSHSYCINAATSDTSGIGLPPLYDFTGVNIRICDTVEYSRADIGAFEYQGNGTRPQLVFDCDFDWHTDNIGLENMDNGAAYTEPGYNNSRFVNKDALGFEGSMQYVDFMGLTSIRGNNQLTISLWINPWEMNTDQEYVLLSDRNNGSNWELALLNSKLVYTYWSSGTMHRYESNAAFYVDAWQHAAVVYNGTDIIFYKNGNDYHTVTATGEFIDSNASNLQVGSFNGTNYYAGDIGDLKIYDGVVPFNDFDLLLEDFGLRAESWNNKRTVKFEVNMSSFIKQLSFNPQVDFVGLAGSFNSWDASEPMNDADSNGIYEIMVENLNIGEIYDFKFLGNGTEDSIFDTFTRSIVIQDITPAYFACMNNECDTNDVAVIALVSPQSGTLSSSEILTIEFKNVGSDTLNTNYSVSYNVNEGIRQTDITAIIQLAPGQSGTHALPAIKRAGKPNKINLRVEA